MEHSVQFSQKKKSEPWQDRQGQTLPVPVLELVSQRWSQDTWERYLASLEGSRGESLLEKPQEIEQFSEYPTIWDCLGNDQICRKEQIESEVAEALKLLTEREKEVLQLIFWEGSSLGQAALCLNLSRSSVREYRNRALIKLHDFLWDSFESNWQQVLEFSVRQKRPCRTAPVYRGKESIAEYERRENAAS